MAAKLVVVVPDGSFVHWAFEKKGDIHELSGIPLGKTMVTGQPEDVIKILETGLHTPVLYYLGVLEEFFAVWRTMGAVVVLGIPGGREGEEFKFILEET